MFQPIARLTQVTSKVSAQLFSIDADAINGSESSYIENVLSKIARFFETDMHKVTTLYTPDNAVWTIDVKREKEEIARVVGSTHRITLGDLHNMVTGSKMAMVQKLMFVDFLNDPLAIRYFHTFLATSKEEGIDDSKLLFWEEIRRYKRSMSSATFHARRIFKLFCLPESDVAMPLSDDLIQMLYNEIILGNPNLHTFDVAEKETLEVMRTDYFPAFLQSSACESLIVAKRGLPKAIMVENEFGQEELDELEDIMGCAAPVKLNFALRKKVVAEHEIAPTNTTVVNPAAQGVSNKNRVVTMINKKAADGKDSPGPITKVLSGVSEMSVRSSGGGADRRSTAERSIKRTTTITVSGGIDIVARLNSSQSSDGEQKGAAAESSGGSKDAST